ncbi:MAG: hypothetical protein ACYYK0_01615 [Candidatus Eutrophobiaceae bacterium]
MTRWRCSGDVARAEQGDADAQTNLGKMHFNGRGVSQNYKMAVQWWQVRGRAGGCR